MDAVIAALGCLPALNATLEAHADAGQIAAGDQRFGVPGGGGVRGRSAMRLTSRATLRRLLAVT